MHCPACSQPTEEETLDGRYGRRVTLDLCFLCGVLWFDGHESLGLAPGAVLRLFVLIHERRNLRRGGTIATPVCPRCKVLLERTQDSQRNVRFAYWRCPERHGRLTQFVEFLREKHFVRPLGAAEIGELRKNVKVVHCDSCGAPVELEKNSGCSYCGAALSVLDARQVEKIVAELRAAEAKRQSVDPELPARLAMDRLEVERFFQQLDPTRRTDSLQPREDGLIEQGLAAIVDLLTAHRSVS